MHRSVRTFWMGLSAVITLSAAAAPVYLSPVAIAPDAGGGRLFIAAHTAGRLFAVDLARGKVADRVGLPGPPTGLAVSPDGARLYVTCGGPDGLVCAVDTAAMRAVASTPVGAEAVAPVITADGKTLYVCSRFTDSVVCVDAASLRVTGTIAVTREPVAAAITPDGALLVVANLLPGGPSSLDYVSACATLVDTATRQTATVQLPNGSTGLHGVCVSPDGAFAYVTHILARYQLPTTQLERGWMNTNALTVIDLAGRKALNTVLLDDVDLGAANPWGVACTADGAWICVTHAGTHEISVIDRAALHAKLGRAAAGERVSEVTASAADVPNDLSFLVDIRRRITLPGNGPRGLALVGSTAYAAMYFSDSIAAVDVLPDVAPHPRSIALVKPKALTEARKGEMFFHDADLCFQHWQSCVSCHPDGRVDGLNWDLLNDGMGNPKNTKSLLLSHETPPVMAMGVRDTAEMAVRSGIRFIQFAVRPEEDALAIDTYLKGLRPYPSPLLRDGKLTEAAQRGQKVFEAAGCAECHPAPLYTTCKEYDVGTGVGRDEGRLFDTPTLHEIWRTAPYLHDGRAATLRDILTPHNPGDKHGTTSKLTPAQLDDLVAFMASL